MTARQILEAVIQPDPKALRAFDRSRYAKKWSGTSYVADLQKRDKILKPFRIKMADENSSFTNSSGAITLGSDYGEDTLGHELIHRGQFARTKRRTDKALRNYPKVKMSGEEAPAEYWTHPWELMAHAYAIAKHLKRRYGRWALRALKDGRWRDCYLKDEIEQYFTDPKVLNRFIRYAAAYISGTSSSSP